MSFETGKFDEEIGYLRILGEGEEIMPKVVIGDIENCGSTSFLKNYEQNLRLIKERGKQRK